MKKKEWKLLSQVFMAGAVFSIALAGIGYFGIDIWLASTQWLLAGTILALFGLYCQKNG